LFGRDGKKKPPGLVGGFSEKRILPNLSAGIGF
jgi:hypothetical protein